MYTNKYLKVSIS